MIMLTPHFATISEKEKIMVCFVNSQNEQVARAVIKTNESEKELADRAIESLSRTHNFVIGKPVNGRRWSESNKKLVPAGRVSNNLVKETLKKIVAYQNKQKIVNVPVGTPYK